MRVAVIPARGGSRRIPRKNIKLFHGKPIIAYSIETAKASGLFDEVFVTTDDFEIASIAERYGAHALGRPEELSVNGAGTQEVVKWVLTAALTNPPTPIDYVCCIYATAPMMLAGDLRRGFDLVSNSSMNYAFSIGTRPCLHDAGQWYWGHASAFANSWPLFDALTYMVPIPAERVCDINLPEDWIRAEEMYARLHGIETRSQAMERLGL